MKAPKRIRINKSNYSSTSSIIIVGLFICALTAVVGYASATMYHMMAEKNQTITATASDFMTQKRQWLDNNCTKDNTQVSHNPNPEKITHQREVVQYTCPSPFPTLDHERVTWVYLHGDF